MNPAHTRTPRTPNTRRLAVLLALVALLGIAAPHNANAGILGYFRDRGADFLDILRLRFIVPERGEGYGAKARVTSLAQVGYVHVDGTSYGMDRRAIGANAEQRTEGGISLAYFSRTRMDKQWGNSFLDPETPWNKAYPRGIVRNLPYWDDGRRQVDSVGAEVQLGLFGLDIGLYPTQALDFAVGWLGFDIFRDDLAHVNRLTEYSPPPPPAADTPEPLRDLNPDNPPASLPSEDAPPEEVSEPIFSPQSQTPSDPAPPTKSTNSDPVLGSEWVRPADLTNFQSQTPASSVEVIQSPFQAAPAEPAAAPEPGISPEDEKHAPPPTP